MILAVAIAVLVVLAFALVVAVARDQGAPAEEVATGYELAWDRLDFDALWALSDDTLRDGLGRHDFVAAKRVAYADRRALRGLVQQVRIEDAFTGSREATVTTRVELRDGSVVRNRFRLVRSQGAWRVHAYALAPGDIAPRP